LGKLLWQPSKKVIEKANITRYVDFVNERYGLKIDPYAARSYFKLL
jgi:acetoacetyl-CoA synthetase